MIKEQKFVAFNLQGMNSTDKLVATLLSKSISYMNDIAREDPSIYMHMSGSDVEVLSCNSMKEVAPSVGFPQERIDLVSGHAFPDIILHACNYGVEIKSTQKDSWTSTGSSIVESSRNKEAERIYMLFGKLGGSPEFRCKPYQQCLSNIAVTHAPRYLIDMDLNASESIFSKMNTDYDVFRLLPETEKISKVRQYYIEKARNENKYEMPWWMEETTNVNLAFYNDLAPEAKNEILARACILFRSLYSRDGRNRYRPISLWLCNNYSLLCPNMRDDFSAGGQCYVINGEPLKTPYPHIVVELLKNHDQIKALLHHPDEDILRSISDYWDFSYKRADLYGSWLAMIEDCFQNNPQLSFVPIRELLEKNAKPF
ncbi:MAG: hypothetical protein KAZ98_05655 [Prevotella sp.]|nr:hypothetical protein [Prevotella sp.]